MTTRRTGRPNAQPRVDRGSPTPLYHQLEQLIRSEIESGVLRPGDLLPSEHEICAKYGVSRSVTRQTLQNLAHSGVIRTERRRGSFVAERKLTEGFVQLTTGFYEDVARLGLEIRTRIVRQEITEAPLEVRDFLGASRVLRIDRLRSVAGKLVTFVVTYLPPDRVPELEAVDLTDRSLYATLEERYGLRVDAGDRTVEAVAAQRDAARYLEVPEGAPLLLLRSQGRTRDGKPLEWYEAWHRGDRTRFEVRMAPRDEPLTVPASVVPIPPDVTPAVGSLPGSGPTLVADFRAALEADRIVAVVRAPVYGDGAVIAAGLRDGGVRMVEFTLTGSNALKAIAQARRVEGVMIGVGSVIDIASARQAMDAGAQFIVCPAEVSEVAELAGIIPVVLAGLTPSEVLRAYRLTGGPVKLFPASSMGPGHVRAVLAPMPQVPLVPSGGIDARNLGEYLAAGAIAVNIGTPLCPVDAVTSADAPELTRRARLVTDAISAFTHGR